MIITAEAAGSLPKTRAATGYNGEAISDPDHAIAGELKGRFELDVAISDKGGYPYGMAQPAVLVLKNDGTVVYKWAIVPKLVCSPLSLSLIFFSSFLFPHHILLLTPTLPRRATICAWAMD